MQTHPGVQVVGPVQPVPPHWPVARGLALEVVDVLVVVGVVVVVVVVEKVVELVLFFELVVVVEVVPLPPLLPLTIWLTWLTIATIWTPKDIEHDSNQHDDSLGGKCRPISINAPPIWSAFAPYQPTQSQQPLGLFSWPPFQMVSSVLSGMAWG